MLCNVSLQVLPSVPDEQLYPVVDQVIELIKESGVKYVVGLWKPPWRENSISCWRSWKRHKKCA